MHEEIGRCHTRRGHRNCHALRERRWRIGRLGDCRIHRGRPNRIDRPDHRGCFCRQRSRGLLAKAYLVAAFAFVALGMTSCALVPGAPSSQSSFATSGARASNEQEINVDLDKLAQSLPEEGLPEKYIDETFLGRSDKVERKGDCTFYTWYAKNGSKDEIFYAGCANGAVVVTLKLGYQFGTVYWPDSDGLPNLYAESPSKKESGKAPAQSHGSSDASAGNVAGGESSDASADSAASNGGGSSSSSNPSKKPNKYSPRDYDSAEDWEADTGGSLDEWDRQ